MGIKNLSQNLGHLKAAARPFSQAPKNQGFTLIEILIAITILGLLMVGVYTVMDNSMKARERLSVEDRRLIEVEMGLARIEADLAQIYTPLYFSAPYSKWPGQKLHNALSKFRPRASFVTLTDAGIPAPIVDTPSKDSLVFMMMGNKRKFSDSKESHFAWVKYSLSEDQDKTGVKKNDQAPFTLIRQYKASDIYQNATNWDDVKGQALIRNIKSLDFEFFDKSKKKYATRLQDLTNDKYNPPAVKIILKWVDSNNYEQVSQRVYRPLWPYFNTLAEQKELINLYKQAQAKAQSKSTVPGADGDIPINHPDEDEIIDE